jgi:AbrB family looped-hinge helix DNA binding protein
MATVTVSTKYQVVIPKKFRESLKIRPGQKIQILEYDGRLEFIPLHPMKTMRGSLKGMDTTLQRDPDRI